MKLAHSYSSLKMFENCPLNYYRQRIIKDVKDTGNTANNYGDRVHKAFELRLRDKVPLDPTLAHHEPLCAAVERAAAATGAVLTVEHEMTLDAQLMPTTWWAQDAWLRSKVDVLVRRESRATVLDWKTGKRRPDFDQLQLFALQVFTHFPEIEAVHATFVWLPANAKDSHTFHRANASQGWEQILAKVHRIEAALQADNWPAKPSGLCGWCPCKPTCKFAR